MRRRDDGIVRFAKDVKKAFDEADRIFRQLVTAIKELDERLTELEEYVADEGTERRH